MADNTIKSQFATRENFLKLESLEKQNSQLLEEAEALDQCGVDCQVFRTLSETFKFQLQQYREKFFTPPPEV